MVPVDNMPVLGAPIPLDMSPKRHCPKGHELNTSTEYYDPHGKRYRCRTCQSIANRKSQHRRKLLKRVSPPAAIEVWIAEQDWELAHARQRLNLRLPD